MLRKDFNFALPQGLIASTPLDRRRDSRLMVVDPVQGISHRRFTDLLGYLKQGDLIVVGNSILSNSAQAIKEITAPFQGLYSTYRLYELISE